MVKIKVYDVVFKDGIPTVPDSVYHTMISRGITDDQIKDSFDALSRAVIKKCLKPSKIEGLRQ